MTSYSACSSPTRKPDAKLSLAKKLNLKGGMKVRVIDNQEIERTRVVSDHLLQELTTLAEDPRARQRAYLVLNWAS
jgi:hypothetical protein